MSSIGSPLTSRSSFSRRNCAVICLATAISRCLNVTHLVEVITPVDHPVEEAEGCHWAFLDANSAQLAEITNYKAEGLWELWLSPGGKVLLVEKHPYKVK